MLLENSNIYFFTGNNQNLIPVVDDALVMTILNINNNIKYYLGSKQDALLLFPPITTRTGTRGFYIFIPAQA